MQLLNKFRTKLGGAAETTAKVDVQKDTTGEKKLNDNDDDDDDPNWMTRPLRCEDNAPVLAKDASTKGDDWFEIYDPRNPINKRRRGEDTDRSKKKRT